MATNSPKIFISYAQESRQAANILTAKLKSAGVEFWIDYSELRAGNSLPEHIGNGLRECNVLVLLWSKAASQSYWVKLEWENALTLQKGIIPCILDDTPLPGLLANLIYLDFRDLKRGLEDLIRAINILRSEEGAIVNDRVEKLAYILRKQFTGAFSPVWNVPYLRNSNFTGRDKLLEQMASFLSSDSSMLAIYGLGGVGKTQLITEYAYRYSDNYEIIWWLRARNRGTLSADYVKLSYPLGLHLDNKIQKEYLIDAVRNFLTHSGKWLLIFDNASQMSDIEHFLPPQNSGHIVITSRSSFWNEVNYNLSISEFTEDESIEFLRRRTNQDDKINARELADALCHFPLALEQAGAYITSVQIGISDYLDLYKKYRYRLFEDAKQLTNYELTATETLKLSLKQIEKHLPAAIDLLKLLAFLPSEEIPYDLLTNSITKTKLLQLPVSSISINWILNKLQRIVSSLRLSRRYQNSTRLSLGDPLTFYKAVSYLRTLSLIELSKDKVSMNRIIRLIVHDYISDQEKKVYSRISTRLFAQIGDSKLPKQLFNQMEKGEEIVHVVIGKTSHESPRKEHNTEIVKSSIILTNYHVIVLIQPILDRPEIHKFRYADIKAMNASSEFDLISFCTISGKIFYVKVSPSQDIQNFTEHFYHH